jgi:hypothetical protein
LLVRPDEHVAARFTSLDAQSLRAAIDHALGRKPGDVGSFVPVEHVDRVVPYTPAEALFSRLATDRGFEDGDIGSAINLLVRGMAAADAIAGLRKSGG